MLFEFLELLRFGDFAGTDVSALRCRYLHFAGGTFSTTQPDWVAELSPAQQAVVEPPYIYNRPLIDNDGDVIKPRVG